MELSRKMVYVGNLPPSGVNEAALKAAFIPFGEINQIVMPSAANQAQ